MRCRPFSFVVVLLLILGMSPFLCRPASSQGSTVAPRIVGPVDESALTALSGNVTARARSEFDKGEAAPATQLTSMRLVLSRSAAQQAALEIFMAEQLDPASANYHRWLTPQEFGKLYGPADSDIAAMVAWLQSHGLTVGSIPPGRTDLPFSGSVRQVEEALHVSIHSFAIDGEQFYSNIDNPRIPAALSAVVAGVAHLNTVAPRPHAIKGGPGQFDFVTNRLQPAGESAIRPSPELTSSNGKLYITPADAATIYNTPNSLNLAFTSGGPYSGQGVTIGIGGAGAVLPGTVVNYRSRFMNDFTPPTITNVNNTAITNGATDEAYLDLEVAGGLAPGAALHFYTSANLGDAISQAINDNTIDIFSLSFGECEHFMSTSDNQWLNNSWQQAAAQGIAVTVSSGDGGSAGCDDFNNSTAAQYGLQVSGFASTPYNIAVGGTDYYALINNFSTYVSSSNASNYRSANGYIPESAWNDSTTTYGLLGANVPRKFSCTTDASGYCTNIVAGSGGASSCSTNATTYDAKGNPILGTCTSGYPKPFWQRGTGVPNDKARDIPDVSLMAGNGVDNAAWLVCTDDTFTSNGSTYSANCSDQGGGGFAFFGFGGTSASAPAFAGILALVQQKTGTRLGLAAKTLYDLSNGPNASAVFHNAVGNISVVCASGTPNCSKNSAGYYFLTGYDSTTGYDLATGLGSVDATQLINYWGTGPGSAKASVTVTPASAGITTNQVLTVNVTVAGSGSLGTPTGTVTLFGGGFKSSTANLGSGAASIDIPAASLPVGTNTLSVFYSGDNVYASGTGTATVTVSALTATVTVTPSSANVTSNQSFTLDVKVSGSGPTPTGNVGTYNFDPQTLSNGKASISIPGGFLNVGTNTLTVSYWGDSVYSSNSGATTVNAVGPTVTIVASPSNPTVSDSVTVTVTVASPPSFPAPTGNVNLFTNLNRVITAPLSSAGTAVFTLPSLTLTQPSDTLHADYTGDSNYARASAMVGISVTGVTPTMIVTPLSSSIQSNQPLNVTATIKGSASAPTGTVLLSAPGYVNILSLSNGSVTFTIPPNSLTAGTDTLSMSYSGDNYYTSVSGSATVSVIQYVPLIPTITVTPAAPGISTGQTLNVAISVKGTGVTPTGTVNLSGGSFGVTNQTLASGSTTVAIPANALTAGTDTLTATYSGDLNYAPGSASAKVEVAQSLFSLAATTPTAVTKGGTVSSVITLSSSSSYSGSVIIDCSLTQSPAGAAQLPVCAVAGNPVTLTAGTPSGNPTVRILTTAATAGLARPRIGAWAGGGAVLALAFFFGFPARRRYTRAMLGLLIIALALGSVSACGGGGGSSSSGGGGSGSGGTTSGQYTFTVTANGIPPVSPAPTATFVVTVN